METNLKRGDVVIFDVDSNLCFPPLYMVSSSNKNNGEVKLRRAKKTIKAHRTELSKAKLSIVN